MATTPFPYVANAILTASQLNSAFNIPVSAKTASYVLTAADAGTRVTMSSASATTITVNTSLFSAGDNLEITNIGAGVCTVTAGTATVSTSGTLALVANAGGTLYFTSAGVSVFIASGVAASASGLAFITSTAVSSTSFSINNCFSATYKNYKIIYPFTVSDQNMTMRLRVGGSDNSTSNYDRQLLIGSGSSASAARTLGGTGWTDILGAEGASYWDIDIFNPFEAARTSAWIANGYTASSDLAMRIGALQQRQATSFDGFTISGSNTMTGTAYVYGYSLS